MKIKRFNESGFAPKQHMKTDKYYLVIGDFSFSFNRHYNYSDEEVEKTYKQLKEKYKIYDYIDESDFSYKIKTYKTQRWNSSMGGKYMTGFAYDIYIEMSKKQAYSYREEMSDTFYDISVTSKRVNENRFNKYYRNFDKR